MAARTLALRHGSRHFQSGRAAQVLFDLSNVAPIVVEDPAVTAARDAAMSIALEARRQRLLKCGRSVAPPPRTRAHGMIPLDAVCPVRRMYKFIDANGDGGTTVSEFTSALRHALRTCTIVCGRVMGSRAATHDRKGSLKGRLTRDLRAQLQLFSDIDRDGRWVERVRVCTFRGAIKRARVHLLACMYACPFACRCVAGVY